MRHPGQAALGLAAYLLAIGSMAYFAFFVAGFAPRSVDRGPLGPPWIAAAIDLALVASFGLVHSLLARAGARAWLARRTGPALERSFFTLVAGAQIVLLEGLWRPLPTPVWSVGSSVARALLWALQAGGWVIVLAALWAVGSAALFGLDRACAAAHDRALPEPELAVRGIYRQIRHPLYLGTALALWAAPDMSLGHLLLATSMTLYLAIGLVLEERDLVRLHGAAFLAYREAVPAWLPRFRH